MDVCWQCGVKGRVKWMMGRLEILNVEELRYREADHVDSMVQESKRSFELSIAS